MNDLSDLSGAVAVVTGATRGLGRAMARQLGEAGAQVVVVGRSTHAEPHRFLPGTLEEVQADFRSRGIDVLTVRADLSQPHESVRVVDECMKWAGRCDILICNASYTPAGSFFDVQPSRWTTGWNITVLSSVILCQGFLPGMLERKSGRVLAIGSRASAYDDAPASDWTPRPEGFGPPLLYAVSKAALDRVITGLHDDFGGQGVTFNNLRAGEMTSEAYGLMSRKMGYETPTEQIHTPDEVAVSVLWLLRQPASFSGRLVDFDWLIEQGALVAKQGG